MSFYVWYGFKLLQWLSVVASWEIILLSYGLESFGSCWAKRRCWAASSFLENIQTLNKIQRSIATSGIRALVSRQSSQVLIRSQHKKQVRFSTFKASKKIDQIPQDRSYFLISWLLVMDLLWVLSTAS
ncbi:Uncharacterized protein Rs2_39218 [Raphanus sativus]|nr:Uncharacterized protein Rs2_39218 [Raphanus sativus]